MERWDGEMGWNGWDGEMGWRDGMERWDEEMGWRDGMEKWIGMVCGIERASWAEGWPGDLKPSQRDLRIEGRAGRNL
mgnify:CR=1 FL=1|jgi:hypothetical protein